LNRVILAGVRCAGAAGPLLASVALVASFAVSAAAQPRDFSGVEIRTLSVSESVSMLVGEGGNIAVSVGGDGTLMIDDQFAPLTPKLLSAVEELGGGPVRLVINTHWHSDHTGGNENLGRAGALLFGHDAVRERMSTEQFTAAFGRRTPPSPEEALPVVTFSETLSLHWNGDAIRAVHVANAHTDGDSIIHFTGADVIHMGDTFFNGMYPFVDVSAGGSLDGIPGTGRWPGEPTSRPTATCWWRCARSCAGPRAKGST
jgi:glyoxylase-like metal-dependent hydrolase (beta-lactamase superfamily II)